jgi:hypothetical protein
VSAGDAQDLLFGTLQGLAFSTLFLLAAFIGFCIVAGFSKLRPTSARTMVIKSLEERVGQERYARFLPPDAPRGPVDVLRTPGTSALRAS